MDPLIIRPLKAEEIDEVAAFISEGYYNDIFFKWVVADDSSRQEIVTGYYKAYLHAKGSVVHIAEKASQIVGATVWLPHDVDPALYDKIDEAAGRYAPHFRAVADLSHCSEPPMAPFYQLVGIVVSPKAQGLGIGGKLLKFQLDKLDKLGIPTYLEASTPYFGGGIYGKFGYQPVGELIVFTKDAILYPLWRSAKPQHNLKMGGISWTILEEKEEKLLIISKNIVEEGRFHSRFENVFWLESEIRAYLNGSFLERFSKKEQKNIVETVIPNPGNPWYHTPNCPPTTDQVFLLSLEETLRYLGDARSLSKGETLFFIDDPLNPLRKAVLLNGKPSRWLLRTAGSTPEFVSVVANDGRICVSGDFVNRNSSEIFNVGFRPAMWIRKSEGFNNENDEKDSVYLG